MGFYHLPQNDSSTCESLPKLARNINYMGQFSDFDRRVNAVHRKHAGLANGTYTARVRQDGLIVAAPVKSGRMRFNPLSSLLILTAAVIGFKSLLLGSLGEEDYNARVASLAAGNEWEKAGAWVLQIEPLTEFVTYDAGPQAVMVWSKVKQRIELSTSDFAEAAPVIEEESAQN